MNRALTDHTAPIRFVRWTAPLSRRQREVYDALVAFVEREGRSPTLRELGDAIGLSSIATVHSHVLRLERFGLVHRAPGSPKISLAEKASAAVIADIKRCGDQEYIATFRRRGDETKAHRVIIYGNGAAEALQDAANFLHACAALNGFYLSAVEEARFAR